METQNHLLLTPSPAPILWRLLIPLAAIQAIFTLSWVIYRAHLAGVLTQFGFSEQAAPRLLLVETLMAIALEPIVGKLSDRTEQRHGTRLPWITVGLGLTALLFVVIAVWVALTQPANAPRWEIIVVALVWAIAMSLFRTPVLALLRHCATSRYLPQAASLLTLAGGIAGATAAASPIIRNWGVSLTFGIAAVLLGGAWIVLNTAYSSPHAGRSEVVEQRAVGRSPLVLRLGLILGLGFTTTWVLRLVIESYPKLLKIKVPTVNPALLVALIFVTLALTALPSGIAGVRFGNRKTMLVGFGAMIASLGLMTVPTSPLMATIAALALGASLGIISNGTLPFTLLLVSTKNTGLAVGTFFAGGAIAVSCLTLLGTSSFLSTVSPVLIGGFMLLVAALCITLPVHSLENP